MTRRKVDIDPRPKQPKKFVAYFRVSTTKQAKSGLGLDAQRATVGEFINGGNLVAEFTEIESGKKNDRPELEAALKLAKQEKATLVVAKLDRLGRNLYFVASLMEANIDFICCDMPEANKLTIHLLAAMAEYERELISERTTKALASVRRTLKRDGTKVSASGNIITRLGSPSPEIGSRAGVKARRKQANTFAAKIQPIIADLEKRGYETLRDIAKGLNDMGIESATGGEWHPSSVSNVRSRKV